MFKEVFDKLPYRFGSEAWKLRRKQAFDKGEKPKEVNCFGTDKFEIVGKRLVVKVFNEKLGVWQEHIGVEYVDVCCICGSLMLVRAIRGTTWLALCSKECYEKFDKLRKEKRR